MCINILNVTVMKKLTGKRIKKERKSAEQIFKIGFIPSEELQT